MMLPLAGEGSLSKVGRWEEESEALMRCGYVCLRQGPATATGSPWLTCFCNTPHPGAASTPVLMMEGP